MGKNTDTHTPTFYAFYYLYIAVFLLIEFFIIAIHTNQTKRFCNWALYVYAYITRNNTMLIRSYQIESIDIIIPFRTSDRRARCISQP